MEPQLKFDLPPLNLLFNIFTLETQACKWNNIFCSFILLKPPWYCHNAEREWIEM